MPDSVATFWEKTAFIAIIIFASLILFAGAIALLVFLTRKHLRKYKPVDMAIFHRLRPWATPQKNKIVLFITFLGGHKFLIPANLLLLAYFLLISDNRFSIRIVAIALSSLVLMLLLKWLFQRKRPLAPLLKAVRGLSFPSGHAIMAVTFYGLIIYIISFTIPDPWVNYSLTGLLVLLILLIGFTRVYLHVHYASDVVAGFIIGLLWLCITLVVLNRIEEYSEERTQSSQSIRKDRKESLRSLRFLAPFASQKSIALYPPLCKLLLVLPKTNCNYS